MVQVLTVVKYLGIYIGRGADKVAHDAALIKFRQRVIVARLPGLGLTRSILALKVMRVSVLPSVQVHPITSRLIHH
eukprot:3758508-Pyramimonas_sp.AAC.1